MTTKTFISIFRGRAIETEQAPSGRVYFQCPSANIFRKTTEQSVRMAIAKKDGTCAHRHCDTRGINCINGFNAKVR